MITGEGRLDEQTLYGKTPAGVAVIASAAGVPVVAIAGTLGVGYQRLRDIGIVAAFSITSGPMTLESACSDAATLLRDRASDLVQLWKVARVGVPEDILQPLGANEGRGWCCAKQPRMRPVQHHPRK